ncbi:MAG TPA: hypothetical protein PL193_10005 [Xanthobacteraceae bacterium]|nr:hypothetical protein [Xanthobacteraceae bacterium]
MSAATDWLAVKFPSFRRLRNEEIEAISDFTLLWSLYEQAILNLDGNPTSIYNAAIEIMDNEDLLPAEFERAIEYFQDRYIANGTFNAHFESLNFRTRDRRQLVEAVLIGEAESAGRRLAALLLIVYRLRNNLFHGQKWETGFRDQYSNFQTANSVLKSCIDRHLLEV